MTKQEMQDLFYISGIKREKGQFLNRIRENIGFILFAVVVLLWYLVENIKHFIFRGKLK